MAAQCLNFSYIRENFGQAINALSIKGHSASTNGSKIPLKCTLNDQAQVRRTMMIFF